MSGRPPNPDIVLLRRAIDEHLRDVPFDANPLTIDLGTRLLEAAPGRVLLSFEPGARYVQGGGVIAGGIVATMLDFALGFAILTQLEPHDGAGTVALTVNFMKAARAGRLQVEGVCEKLGRTVGFSRATMTAADGSVIATATSPMAVMRTG